MKMKNEAETSSAMLPDDRPSTAANLVAIAENSIVSRVLARSEGGSVTLFAFDRGQALSEHTAPFDALVQVLTGALTVTIGGQEVELHSGELVRMPAGVPHSVRAPEPCRMLLTMLRGGKEGT